MLATAIGRQTAQPRLCPSEGRRRSPLVKAEKVADDVDVIEIKARVGDVQPRALVSVIGDHDDEVLVLHCLAKKERSLKRSDIDLAEQRLADRRARSGA